MLDWKGALAHVPVLIRQMFWTYAGYILCINLFFGIISILFADELLSGNGLAKALLLLITIYWLSRVIIQFTYFDRSSVPQKLIYKAGEFVLVTLFIVFTLIYGYATRVT